MNWVDIERRSEFGDTRTFLLALLLRFAVNLAALYLAAEIVPGMSIGDFWSGVVAAVILGAMNAFVRPVMTILTCPLTILTLGLFLLVINMTMLALTAWLTGLIGFDFDIDDFWAAFFGALIVGLISLIANLYLSGTRQRLRMSAW
jgi:putative membrane protein